MLNNYIKANKLASEQAGKLASEQAGKLASEQANKLASWQAGKLASKQAGRLASKQASKLASRQAGKQERKLAGWQAGKPAIVCFSVFLFLLIPCTAVFAELLGDIVKPFVSAREVYDSNIFRVRDKVQLMGIIGDDHLSDYITQVSAGATLHYEISSQKLEVLLKKDFLRYRHYSSQNADQDEAGLKLSLRAYDRISANITGRYSKTVVPREDYRTQRKAEQKNKAGGVSLGYDLPSGFRVQIGFEEEKVDYSLAELSYRERTNKDYTATGSYSPTPDSRFYASYVRNDLDYKKPQLMGADLISNNSSGNTLKFGIEKKFSPRTILDCFAGYTSRRHQEFKSRNFNGVIGGADLRYGLTEKLVVSVTAERKLYEELFLDQIYSVNNAFGLGITYMPTEQIKTYMNGAIADKSFEGNSTAGAGRKDRFREFRTGVVWSPVNRLELDLLYRFANRTSNFNAYDYNDYGIELGISYKF